MIDQADTLIKDMKRMVYDDVVEKSLDYDESLFIGDKSGIYDRILQIKDNIVDKQENLLVFFILYIKLKSSRF